MLSAGYASNSHSSIAKKREREEGIFRVQGVLEGGPERLLLRQAGLPPVMLRLLAFFSPSVFLLPESMIAELETTTNLSSEVSYFTSKSLPSGSRCFPGGLP